MSTGSKDKGKRPKTDDNQLWTDKYKPKTYDEVIGNKALVQKLALWLNNW
jgi:hypothetical protein